MSLLNEQEKEIFTKLARSQDADIIKGYFERVIQEVVDVDSLTSDPILNARTAKQILLTALLEPLKDNQVEPKEKETWE